MTRKLLHLSLTTLLLAFCHAAWAANDDVTIDLSQQGYDNAEVVTTVTQSPVTLTFDKAEGSYAPTYYNTGPGVRIYKGNTLTVTAGGTRDISKIVMYFAGSNYSPTEANFTVDCGQAQLGTTTTWSGLAPSVTFTRVNESSHWRLSKLVVCIASPALPEVTSITQLRQQESGTQVRLTFSRDNQGNIQWVEEGDNTYAYVRDNGMAVRFTNFLPDDAGWHADAGGALIGSVDGEYKFINGMPEFTHISTSIADSILCLDNWQYTPPTLVTDLSDLQGTDYRADYVVLEGVFLTDDGEGNYTIVSGDTELPMTNRFGVSDIIPDDLRGRIFQIHGILGTTDDGSASRLYYTQIDEMMPDLTLSEDRYDNATTLATFDNRNVKIHVQRPMLTGKWNTLCLPFDIYGFSEIVSSAKLAELTGFNDYTNTLEFTSAEDLKAGVPYLVFPRENVDEIVIMGTTLHNEVTPVDFGTWEMRGVFSPTTLYAGDTGVLFLGADNTLYYPSVTNDLKAFRAYFTTTSSANAASICIDGMTTDIRVADIDGYAGTGKIYNVSGQFMGTTTSGLQKGVYVRDGNKVIIR